MKKKILIPLIIVACIAGGAIGGGYFYLNSNTHKEKTLLNNASLDMTNQNYKAALAEYTEILKLDKNNTEATELKPILSNYLTAETAFNKGNLKACSDALNKITPNYKNYSIAKDIDDLKVDLTIKESITKTKSYLKSNDFNEAEKTINSIDLSKANNAEKADISALKAHIMKEKNKAQIKADTENFLKTLNNYKAEMSGFTNHSMASMSDSYSGMQDTLNAEMEKIVDYINTNSQAKNLAETQKDFINFRNFAIDYLSLSMYGGNGIGVASAQTYANLTLNRCYILLKDYLDSSINIKQYEYSPISDYFNLPSGKTENSKATPKNPKYIKKSSLLSKLNSVVPLVDGQATNYHDYMVQFGVFASSLYKVAPIEVSETFMENFTEWKNTLDTFPENEQVAKCQSELQKLLDKYTF